MKTKYIRTENDQIIVFPASMYHTDFKSFQPKSAGFIQFQNNEACCFGESVGLNLSSLPEDSMLATRQFYGYEQ